MTSPGSRRSAAEYSGSTGAVPCQQQKQLPENVIHERSRISGDQQNAPLYRPGNSRRRPACTALCVRKLRDAFLLLFRFKSGYVYDFCDFHLRCFEAELRVSLTSGHAICRKAEHEMRHATGESLRNPAGRWLVFTVSRCHGLRRRVTGRTAPRSDRQRPVTSQ